ncbi:AraC family transcriptional regulator [Halalkalibacter hemicellulosilyticus]|uniref:Two-component response regulator n=1 Tax=Halalkalibacter hemicellulosilyticusJCM 9152 TaxID=1236971 RepID=W4QKB3_9BACI|nr:AraC family transcriptional regulator [Halalkalibacter hemicellulosilyticus]GAE32516.1 two-component response regulator [Halalkalibacter hemicellulosilyticusJCM 9152]
MDITLYEKPLFTNPSSPFRISLEKHTEKGVLFDKHWHEQVELLYFNTGLAKIEVNSESYDASPNDLIIINSNDLHGGIGITDHVSYYCVIIDTSILQNSFIESYAAAFNNLHSSSFTLLNHFINGDNTINELFNQIKNEQHEKKPGYEPFIKAYTLSLMGHLIRHHANTTLSPKKFNTRLRNLDRLNTLLEHLHNHYAEPISVEEGAAHANLSPYYFCRLFKSATGKSFTDYLNNLRVEKAHLLLMNTEFSMTEIAFQTGFNDANYFSRCYKKYKRVSPSAVRKNRLSNR